MERAKWNGDTYLAFQVSRDYNIEKKIRIASSDKQLFCPDEDCPKPILRYCHGEKKIPYFAHLSNCKCDYAEYDKKKVVLKEIKSKIYDHFCNLGYNVRLEEKMIPHHYTDILFTPSDGSKVAIELISKQDSAAELSNLNDQYKLFNIPVQWILVLDDTIRKESETYYAKRFILNETENKTVLMLSGSDSEVIQYAQNQNQIYQEKSSLDKLIFENGEFTISGFRSRYESWLNKKRVAYEQELKQLKNNIQIQKNPKIKQSLLESQLNEKRVANDQEIGQSKNNIQVQDNPKIKQFDDQGDSLLNELKRANGNTAIMLSIASKYLPERVEMIKDFPRLEGRTEKQINWGEKSRLDIRLELQQAIIDENKFENHYLHLNKEKDDIIDCLKKILYNKSLVGVTTGNIIEIIQDYIEKYRKMYNSIKKFNHFMQNTSAKYWIEHRKSADDFKKQIFN